MLHICAHEKRTKQRRKQLQRNQGAPVPVLVCSCPESVPMKPVECIFQLFVMEREEGAPKAGVSGTHGQRFATLLDYAKEHFSLVKVEADRGVIDCMVKTGKGKWHLRLQLYQQPNSKFFTVDSIPAFKIPNEKRPASKFGLLSLLNLQCSGDVVK